MIGLAILVFVLLGLAVYGAGAIPGTAYVAAVLLAVGWLTEHIYFLRSARRHRALRLPFSTVPLACIAVIAYMVITVIPMPGGLPLGGERRAFEDKQVETTLASAEQLGLIAPVEAGGHTLSRNRGGTWRTIVLVLCLMLAAGIAARSKWEDRERLLAGLVIGMAVFAVAGFISQWVIPQGKYLWWFRQIGEGKPVGCFINRNHFAGFVALLCPLALAFCADAVQKWQWRRAGLYGGALALMSLGVLASLSRGAFLAYIAGMTVCGLLLFSRERPALSITVTIIGLLIILGLVFLPSQVVLDRLRTLATPTETDSGMTRLQSWSDATGIWRDYPLLGVGAEGFRSVFGAYRSSTNSKTFYYAENEYVQLLTDLGLVGTGLVILVVLAMLLHVWVDRERFRLSRAVTAGLLGGIATAGAQAMVDFPIRLPLYAILLGCMIGLLHSHHASRVETQFDENVDVAGPPSWAGLVVASGALLLIVGILFSQKLKIYRYDQNSFLVQAQPQELAEALVYAPTQCQIWHRLGLCAAEQGTRPTTRFAEACLSNGARYNPNDYRIWLDLVELREKLDDDLGTLQAADVVFRLRPHYEENLRERALP